MQKTFTKSVLPFGLCLLLSAQGAPGLLPILLDVQTLRKLSKKPVQPLLLLRRQDIDGGLEPSPRQVVLACLSKAKVSMALTCIHTQERFGPGHVLPGNQCV